MSLLSLWLPIVLSAVCVFFASSLLHMVLPLHKKDYRGFDHEDEVRAALRKGISGPGHYIIPYATSNAEASSPEMKAKYEEGPVVMANVLAPGGFHMGKTLGTWMLFCLVSGVFVAYVASFTVDAGSDYLRVFRVAGTVAFCIYALGEPVQSIWRGQPWSNTLRSVFDGLVYALLTGGVFGWLWPSA